MNVGIRPKPCTVIPAKAENDSNPKHLPVLLALAFERVKETQPLTAGLPLH